MVLDTSAGSFCAYIENGNPVGNEGQLEIIIVPWNNHVLGALREPYPFPPTSASSERKIPAKTRSEPQRRILYPAMERIRCFNHNYKNLIFLLTQQSLGKHVAQ